jgi:hypothetical protein
MKILVYPLIKWEYINSPATYIDYMMDGLVHGLIKTYGDDVTLRFEMWHWFKDYPYISELYGKGFTLFGLLDRIKNDNNDLESKLRNQYFDKIVVPIHSSRYNDIVNVQDFEFLNYPREKIAIIDGNDLPTVQESLLKYGTYFKRELFFSPQWYNTEYPTARILPISFAVPREKIPPLQLEKKKELSDIIPQFGGFKTYSFDSEQEYYQEYRNSSYAYTWKKGGWDCLRHYEIVMNSCIPLFKSIEFCPIYIMASWPKSTLSTINAQFPFNYKNEDWRQNNTQSLYKHLINNLTTENLAEYVLENTK